MLTKREDAWRRFGAAWKQARKEKTAEAEARADAIYKELEAEIEKEAWHPLAVVLPESFD